MVTTVLLPMLRTLLLRQVPTTFANRGAKGMLTTVLTVLLTLLRTVHGQTTTTDKDTTANNPRRAVAIRSGRAANGVEVNHGGKGFADRHHLLTKSLWKKRGKTGAAKSDKKRQRTCRNMPPFVAGNLPPFAARSDAHSGSDEEPEAVYRQTSSLSTA
jgi:hypothetical protein